MKTRNIALIAAYSCFCIGISSYALSAFAKIIQEHLAVHYDYRMEMIMVTGQVVFQWLFMLQSCWRLKIRYMLVALTVSMIGSLMLLPLIFYNLLTPVSALNAVCYFFTVVLAIFIVHYALIKKYNLPPRLTLTWVLYRCLLLAFVIYPR